MKLTFKILLFCSVLSAYAQNTFQQGYFIIPEGNTIECLIKNLAWKNNPNSFDYKLSENGDINTKTIDEVKEFSVNDAYKFIRYTVDIDYSTDNINLIDTDSEPKWKETTVFLKVLVEGDATLYQYEEGNLVRYFIQSDNNKPQQLIYKRYKENGIVKQNNKYIGQIYDAMANKISGRENFTKLTYTKASLTDIFIQYNQDTQKGLNNMSSRQNKSAFHLKVTPGIALTSIHINEPVDSRQSFDLNKKLAFRFGMEAEVILPFNNNKWSLFADPNYQTYSNTNKIEDNRQNYYKWDVSYNFLEIPLGARHYMYLNNESKLFLDAAIVLTPFTGNSEISYLHTNSYISYSQKTEISKSTSYALGAGYSYKALSVEARYNFRHGILDLQAWTAEHSSVSLILGYKIL